MGFFTAASTAPFGVAALLLAGLVFLELIGLLLAHNPSAMLDSLIPEGGGDGFWGDALAWLHVGRVPTLVVIMDGGAIILPVFHELIHVNMNTLKLEVHRRERESLITRDRMRVDVNVGFFVRVKQTEESVSTAAQTLGARTLSPDDRHFWYRRIARTNVDAQRQPPGTRIANSHVCMSAYGRCAMARGRASQ